MLLLSLLLPRPLLPGYPLEVHEVVTQDGYLLRMERIPQPASKDAVFMMHGEPVQGASLSVSRQRSTHQADGGRRCAMHICMTAAVAGICLGGS